MGKGKTLVEGKAHTGVNTGIDDIHLSPATEKERGHNRMNRLSVPYLITKYQSGAKHDAGR